MFAFISEIQLTLGGRSYVVDCTNSEHGDLIRSPIDCQIFYICTYSVPLISGCASGQFFDTNLKACNYEAMVDCRVDVTLLGIKMFK